MPIKPTDKEPFVVNLLSVSLQDGIPKFSHTTQSVQRGEFYNAWLLEILSKPGVVCVTTNHRGPKSETSNTVYAERFQSGSGKLKENLYFLNQNPDYTLSFYGVQEVQAILNREVQAILNRA